MANKPSLSGKSGPGDSGRGLGAVPRLSASLDPLLSTGLAPILCAVSYEGFLPLAIGLPGSLDPAEPVRSDAGLRSSGYGARWTRGSTGRGCS